MWYVQEQIVSSKGSVLYNIQLVICIEFVVFIFVYIHAYVLWWPYLLCPECRVCACCRWERRTQVTYYTIKWSLVVWVSSSHRCVHALWSAVLPIVCIPVLFPLFVWCHVSVRNTVALSACIKPRGPEPLHISENCPPRHFSPHEAAFIAYMHYLFSLPATIPASLSVFT